MIDLSKYRIIDLSAELRPGVKKLNGEYLHGRELRRCELYQFIYAPDKMLMHWVETETHIGTHVEGPTHYRDDLKCLADLPIECFLGEAIALDCSSLKPKSGKPQPITPNFLDRVKKGDIVLLWSSLPPNETPHISAEAAKWMYELRVKMVGIQGVGLEPEGRYTSHEYLLANEIPIIEGLTNLEKLRKERFFFMGLPLRWRDMDSVWIRAIALEEL